MQRFKAMVLGGLLAGSLLVSDGTSLAADKGPGHKGLHRPKIREIRQDRKKVNEDLQKLRTDRKSGASEEVIAKDKEQVQEDLKELRNDRKDLRDHHKEGAQGN